jgi:GTP-binding protein YchF
MGLSVGIVGLPNVGKSTIFNALTNAQNAEAANYPFCTIEANKAVVAVPDSRVDGLAGLLKPKQVTRATVDFVDIAGLVRGANKGEGLGNQFLGNIRETDAVLHVVRCFKDENVAHVEGGVDAIRDIEIIESELILSDLQRVEGRIERLTRRARADKALREELALTEALYAHLGEGEPARSFPGHDSELAVRVFREMQLISDKPVIYCCNVDEEAVSGGGGEVARVEELAASRGAETVRICARMEEELVGMEGEERAELLAGYGVDEGGLNKIIHTGYRTLGLISYFTAGPKEVRAWTVPIGCKAPQAAGVIHTDFERGFIRAQVIRYDDYMAEGSESACKAKGLMRQEGKGYEVQDGDVILFLFNV